MNTLNRKISLIGFMGSGKSTVGQALARLLGFPFVDLDTLVEETAGQSIKEIFATAGEQAFRLFEHQALERATAMQGPCVLATGGGVVTGDANRALLKNSWYNIYLSAKPQTILARLEQDKTTRPLLQTEDKVGRIHALMQARNAWYQDVGNLEIAVDEKSVESILESIVSLL